MAKISKKHDVPLRIERFFTRKETDAFDLIHFREIESGESAFEIPDNWSTEAAATFAEAVLCRAIPAYTRSIEENTVPSWLWRRTGTGRLQSTENSVRQVFHRAAGTAAYEGWKKGIFAGESDARAFFDELRYMLAQRFVALEPRNLAAPGLDWAYGITGKTPAPREASKPDKKIKTTALHNTSIDALLGGDKNIRERWQKTLNAGAQSGFLALRFADIASDWNTALPHKASSRAALDLLAFRRDDGAIDIERLGHAVRLLVIMLELQDERGGIILGLHNLAPLLMSQALPYDSPAGRATAAALAAIVTAEAYAASAQLAAMLGPSLDFAANREGVLCALRNHRRAAYGDRNDYEKISVLPAPLTIDSGADLALIAAARQSWDGVLELVPQHGLRFIQMTDLSPAPSLVFFMESAASGIDPMPMLVFARATDIDTYRREIHPAAAEALVKLGYDADARKAIIAHIAGAQTLEHAPGIDHAALRRRGFDNATLEKIEDYLPYVNDIRLAVTPWIAGEEFYRRTLKISTGKINDPHFDCLRHLGFSVEDIATANAFCYGHGAARGAKKFNPAHAAVFAVAGEIAPEAQIRMAAAVQSFVSGDAGLHVVLPEGAPLEDSERLLLGAWRQGIKSIALEFKTAERTAAQTDATIAPAAAAIPAKKTPRPGSSLPQYKAPLHSALHGRPKASGRLIGLKPSGAKSPAGKKHRPGGEDS